MSLIEPYNLVGYKEFIKERRLIYHKKENLKLNLPYTEDEILQTEKFCNIDRENDHQTKYYRKCIENRNIEYKILSSFIFRMGMSSSTVCKAFQEIEYFEELIEYLRSPDTKFSYAGKRISTVPYRCPIVTNNRKIGEDINLGNVRWVFKQINIQKQEILDYFSAPNHNKTPLEMTWELCDLIDTPRKLPFFYHQILADLSVIIPDIVNPQGYTYMAIGAQSGIKGIAKTEGWVSDTPKNSIWYLYDESCKIQEYLEETFFTIEHSACEYNKYSEYLTGVRTKKKGFEKTRENTRYDLS